MRIRNAVAASTAVLAMVALGLLGTADAGPEEKPSNTFTVEKVVDPPGSAPEGAVFEVEVTCEDAFGPAGDATPQDAPEPDVTIKFDATGAPLGPNTVAIGAGRDCTATETVTNGATVTYDCKASVPVQDAAPANNDLYPVKCLDDQTVHFDDIIGAEGTVTVTNTFEPEPEPEPETAPDSVARQPSVVAARPTFTG